MANKSPEIEILELAIAREVDAYKLYLRMAEWASDPQMKEVFEGLANEELDHKARLELELIRGGIVVPSYEKQMLVELENDTDEPKLDMNYQEMLLFAMNKERTSLRLYIKMAAFAKDNTSREMLTTLAEEEAMHQARFEVEYNILMRKKSE